MKRYAWLGVAVAGVAVLLGINAYNPTPVATPDTLAMPVLARDPGLADRIQIVHQGAILDLERRGQTWCLAQNGGYPVKQPMAQRLLDQLLVLRLSHPNTTAHNGVRTDNPKDPDAALTAIRVLATSGAGMGAIIVADHDPAASQFPAHQFGDPKDWQASGFLDAPAGRMAWIDAMILTLDPSRVTGAFTAGVAIGAANAVARVTALQAMKFLDVRPTAQMLAPPSHRFVVTLDNGALTVDIRAQPDQVWLEFHSVAPGVIAIPAGNWVYRYPLDAAALLSPPA